MAGHSGGGKTLEAAKVWQVDITGNKPAGSFGSKYADDADVLRDGADPSAAGKILNDYPNFAWLEARDHFNRGIIQPTNAIQLYEASSIAMYGFTDDEFFEHSAKIKQLANGTGARLMTQEFMIWHTKNDKDNTFTKAIIEFRFKLTRLAGMTLGVGLTESAITQDLSTVAHAKLMLIVDGTGNFKGFTSDGAAETSLDMGASDDNVHKLRLEWTSTQVEFFLDDVSKGTISLTLPPKPLRVVPLFCFNNTGASDGENQMITDYWHYKLE